VVFNALNRDPVDAHGDRVALGNGSRCIHGQIERLNFDADAGCAAGLGFQREKQAFDAGLEMIFHRLPVHRNVRDPAWREAPADLACEGFAAADDIFERISLAGEFRLVVGQIQ